MRHGGVAVLVALLPCLNIAGSQAWRSRDATELIELGELSRIAPGPEAGEDYRTALRETQHDAWRKFGQIVVKQKLASAAEAKKGIDTAGIGKKLIKIAEQRRERDLVASTKLKKQITSLRDRILEGTADINSRSENLKHDAKRAEEQATRLLKPGALKKIAKEAQLLSPALHPDGAKGSIPEVLDVALSPGDASAPEHIEALVTIARDAELEQRKVAKKTETEQSALRKTVAETRVKLRGAIDEKMKGLQSNIVSYQKRLKKIKHMLSNGKTQLEKAKTEFKTAQGASEEGQTQAQKFLEMQSLGTKLIRSPAAKKALKMKQQAEAEMKNATAQIERAQEVESAVDKNDEKDEQKIHDAKMHLLKSQTEYTKANAAMKTDLLKQDEKKKAEEDAYRTRLQKFEVRKKAASGQLTTAKRVTQLEDAHLKELTNKLVKAKKRWLELKTLRTQFRENDDEKQPSATQSLDYDELAKDEAVVKSAQAAAKLVKAKAREEVRFALQREIDKNLILGEQLNKTKQKLADDEEIVKAQSQTIKKDESEEKEEIMQKAKVDAKGAKAMLKEAKHEQKKVVNKEKAAAMQIIAQMKAEIARQLSDARKRAEQRKEDAKQVLAKASGILLEAKAMTGEYEAIDNDSAKEVKQLEDPKVLSKMSFGQLKTMASEQVTEMQSKLHSPKMAGQGARVKSLVQIQLADMKKAAVDPQMFNQTAEADVKTEEKEAKKEEAVLKKKEDKVQNMKAGPEKDTKQKDLVKKKQTVKAEEDKLAAKKKKLAKAKAAESETAVAKVKAAAAQKEAKAEGIADAAAIEAETAATTIKVIDKKLKTQEKIASEAESISDNSKRIATVAVALARVKDLKTQLSAAEKHKSAAVLKNQTASMVAKANSTL